MRFPTAALALNDILNLKDLQGRFTSSLLLQVVLLSSILHTGLDLGVSSQLLAEVHGAWYSQVAVYLIMVYHGDTPHPCACRTGT